MEVPCPPCMPMAFCVLMTVSMALAAQQEPLPADLHAALLAMPLEPPAGSGSVVTVLDAAGKPLTGASVFVYDAERQHRHEAALRELPQRVGDPERQMLAQLLWSCRRRQTGDDGSVRVGEATASVALHGDLLGFSRRSQPGEPVRITVLPVLDCTATAADANGRPAAELELAFALARNDEEVARAPFAAIARTGADGSMHFRLPASLLALLPADYAPRVRAGIIGPVLTASLAIAADGRSATAKLQLPPTGQVRVIVYDDREHPQRGVRNVGLMTAADVQRLPHGMPGGTWRTVAATRTDAEGALFGYVALDQALVATAEIDGVNGTSRAERRGPTQAGELLVFDLRATVGPPRLRGRILGLDGAAVAGELLTVTLLSDGHARSLPLQTTADGSFALAWPADFAAGEAVRVLVMRHGGRGKPTVYGGARMVEMPAEAKGPIDWGDLQLIEEPILLQGIVVDTRGKPVSGVDLEAPLSHLASGGRRAPDLSDHRVRTGADGRFVLRELEPKAVAPTLCLPLQSTQHIVEQRAAAADAADLRIVVAESGTLELAARGAPRQGIAFRLRNQQDAGLFYTFRQEDDGRQVCERLPPGTYDVELRMGGVPVLHIDDLTVREGERCDDPRLADIPWRQHARILRLHVHDASGTPQTPAISVSRDGGPVTGTYRVEADGTAEIALAKDDPGRMRIMHRDYLTQEIADPTGDLDITLLPRPRVQLVLPHGLQLPAGAVVQLLPSTPPWLTPKLSGAVDDNPRELRFRPETLGKQVVVITVGANQPREAWRGDVDIKPGVLVQQIELPIDQAVIDRLQALSQGGDKH